MTIESEKLFERIDVAVLQAKRYARQKEKNADYENGRISGLALARHYLEDLVCSEQESKQVWFRH